MNKKKPYIEVFIYKYPSEYRAVNYRHWGGKVRFWDGVDWWTSIGGSYNRATDAIREQREWLTGLGSLDGSPFPSW